MTVLRPSASACQVGLPATAVDGLVLVPVYQWDAALRVYVLDRQGETMRVDDLASRPERKLDVRCDDAQIKLLLQPLRIASGAYLVSWTYRCHDHRAQCRDLATGRCGGRPTRWSSPLTTASPSAERRRRAAPAVRSVGRSSLRIFSWLDPLAPYVRAGTDLTAFAMPS